MASKKTLSDLIGPSVYYGALLSMTEMCELLMKGFPKMGISGLDYPGFSVNTAGKGKKLRFEIPSTESFKKCIMSIHSHPVGLIVRFVELKDDSFGVFIGAQLSTEHFEDADHMYEVFENTVDLSALLGVRCTSPKLKDIVLVSRGTWEGDQIQQLRKSGGKLNLLYEDKMFYPDWFTSRDGYTPQNTKFDSTDNGAILTFADELMKMNVMEIDECERVRTDSSDPRVVDEFLTCVKAMLKRRQKEHDKKISQEIRERNANMTQEELQRREREEREFIEANGGLNDSYFDALVEMSDEAGEREEKMKNVSALNKLDIEKKNEHFEIEDYSTDEEPFESYPDGTVNKVENVGSQIEKPVLDQ